MPPSDVRSGSYYPHRPEDHQAIYLGSPSFPAQGDGVADDTPSLQRASNALQEEIVSIPPGTCRLRSTVYLWRGILLVGFGERRHRLVLAESTAGFQDETRYTIHFCDERSRHAPDGTPDIGARNTTVFSGLSNLDIEVRPGNPGAVAVRYHVAQHCSIEHYGFFLAPEARGIEAAGNEIEGCCCYGGQVAITTHRTSAGWQWLLLDCTFSGQRRAAIVCAEAGLTALRCRFINAPCAIAVHEGFAEERYLETCTFQDVREAALLLSVSDDPRNQANLHDLYCDHVPTFLRLRDSRECLTAPATRYRINYLSYGLHIADECRAHKASLEYERSAGWPSLARDYRDLPSQETWANVRAFGAVGDGVTDDTAAFRRAIAAHEAAYVPMGRYRLTDTVDLAGDTCLVGLHPKATCLVLEDGEAGLNSPEAPKAMVHSPMGGRNVVTGIGFDPGRNRGAVGLLWRAGERPLVNDVWFAWGGYGAATKGEDQLYSLWVTEGGGGVLKNIWSPGILARNGLYLSDTSTPSWFYLLSVEHHRDVEVVAERAANARFYALQTEENLGSEGTIAVRLQECHDITFANLFLYRVMAILEHQPYGVRVSRSSGLRFEGLHCFSWGPVPFDQSLLVQDAGVAYPLSSPTCGCSAMGDQTANASALQWRAEEERHDGNVGQVLPDRDAGGSPLCL